jgi:hypothetical protein
MPEVALAALALRVGQLEHALGGEKVSPAGMLGELEAVRGLTMIATGRLVCGGGFGPQNPRAAQTEVAGALAGIFQALTDACSAAQGGDRAAVEAAVGALHAGVADTLAAYARLRA